MPLLVDSFAEFWREFVVVATLDAFRVADQWNDCRFAAQRRSSADRENVSAMSRQTEAANILVRNNGWWNADTTDPDVVYAQRQQTLA